MKLFPNMPQDQRDDILASCVYSSFMTTMAIIFIALFSQAQ